MKYLNKNKNKHFLLYSHNFIIKGEEFDLIFDNNRDLIFQIPKGVYKIISLLRVNSIAEIYTKCREEFEEIVLLIQKLQELNLGFFTEALINFPKLKLRKEIPYKEYSKHIEISSAHIDLYQYIEDINTNNTKYIELRIKDNLGENIFESRLVRELNNSSLYGINIVLNFECFKKNRSVFVKISESIEKRCNFFIEYEGKEMIKKYKNVHFYFMNKIYTDIEMLITNRKFFEKKILDLKTKNKDPYIFFKSEFNEL
ncbi:hypothetical protein LPB90_19915 [Chryseobacterium sp. LC2016-29]|uniref:hypothetical protein n=1 Tax=Chryseobacterium sp. LC2016-29 TaxID=2897331 RepID=UPI001E4746B0|nr:hypothetical protein [Chryseobacterium sp. LC2016-29]MCD0480715.1 hypothetical protein [Chryseobacterium sp. LC2016-29]